MGKLQDLCAINIPQGVTIKKNAFNGGKYDEERFEAGKKIDLCSSQFPSLAPSDHFSQKPSFTASENPSFAPTAWPYEIDSTGHVKVPTSVSIIPDNQFEDNAEVKSIYIPKSVTKIGSEAFHNATELKFVKFEAGSLLAIIGKKAFRNCKSLCAINIPQGVTIKKMHLMVGNMM